MMFGSPTPVVRARRCRMLLACLLVAAVGSWDVGFAIGQVNTTTDARREYNVKAVSIYGFCRYVTWPAAAFDSPSSDLVVGVYGDSLIDRPMTAIAAKKSVNHRRLRILKCASAEELNKCHVAFVSRNLSPDERESALQATQHTSVMLVGESTGFAAAGGVANFYIHSGRVRFELNPVAATRRGLKLDAKLLSLGTEIRTAAQ